MAWSLPTETRYGVALLLCIANAICYADRTNIGIAAPLFLPDPADRGIVLSAFFYGYILTQIPAGHLASRIGVKSVLGVGVVVFTVFDCSTIFASRSIGLLVVVRACMGCGEGVVMPSLHRFAAAWFPSQERSTLVAVISSGTDLGTIFALLFSPWIIRVTGGNWRVVFVFFGALSALWLFPYVRYVTSMPEDHDRISAEEQALITSTRRSNHSGPRRGGTNPVLWRTLLTNRSLWVIYAAHFAFNYSWYVLLGWLPTYIHDHLGLDLSQHPLAAALPYICGYVGLLVWGRVSDRLLARGIRIVHVRRGMNSIGSFVPALCLYLLRYAQKPGVAIGLLSCALFTGRACTLGFWVNMIDVGPDYAGEIMGLSNTIGTIPGIAGNLITGYILKHTQSWTIVFSVAALTSVSGGIVFAFGSTDRNVFEDPSSSDGIVLSLDEFHPSQDRTR
ncbi:unnamed protein product [Pseudo-nitzschia multistriata]|uniref:Major facilitator superfamily (MFS) profile domain-containing protein n=1 Tax=Pseudo-nitzschia multistriata TaxID=183589 RepID=A0A448Z5X5_9STRA|nr:unnamed protein product [Pseudo-nitzschia multistriata]